MQVDTPRAYYDIRNNPEEYKKYLNHVYSGNREDLELFGASGKKYTITRKFFGITWSKIWK